jgi:hypothetical protein
MLKKNMTLDPHCTQETATLFSHQAAQGRPSENGRFAVIARLLNK